MDLLIGYIGVAGIILLILMINRQIIGWGLYNIFWPVIMAGLIYSNILIWFSFGILLFSSYVAREITQLFVKRVYASQILKHILYVWLTLLLFWVVHYPGYKTWILSGDIFSQSEIISLLWYILLFSWTMGKNYSYGKGEISFNRLWYQIWFFILSLIIFYCLQSVLIFDLFSGNILALVLLTFAIIGVGIYDGLQLKEMFRFRKLIWNKRTTSKYQKK